MRCEGGLRQRGDVQQQKSWPACGGREYLGILRLGVANEVRKQSVHCQGAQFVLPGRACLAPAGGDGAIRSSCVLRAGTYIQSLS